MPADALWIWVKVDRRGTHSAGSAQHRVPPPTCANWVLRQTRINSVGGRLLTPRALASFRRIEVHKDIDIAFDFRSDTPPGKDPDSHSPTLRRYHKILWSKNLPDGKRFHLDAAKPRVYLYHQSDLGEFFLSSDAVIPSFRKEPRIAKFLDHIPAAERGEFDHITYTIGGMMVFPSNKIGGRMTINGQRGFHPRIKDRFDLTVECIRRYYDNDDDNPLRDTFTRYEDFFKLFVDFRGYAEFFLLQDLVADDFSAVRFFTPFEGFNTSPLPNSLEDYIRYRQLAVDFVQARNLRILESR